MFTQRILQDQKAPQNNINYNTSIATILQWFSLNFLRFLLLSLFPLETFSRILSFFFFSFLVVVCACAFFCKFNFLNHAVFCKSIIHYTRALILRCMKIGKLYRQCTKLASLGLSRYKPTRRGCRAGCGKQRSIVIVMGRREQHIGMSVADFTSNMESSTYAELA